MKDQGEAKGALLALLTGVPKPRVSVSCSLGRMHTPEDVQLRGDMRASAGSQNLNKVSGWEQLFHPQAMGGSKATGLGELWGVGTSQPPKNMQTDSSERNPVLAAHQLWGVVPIYTPILATCVKTSPSQQKCS